MPEKSIETKLVEKTVLKKFDGDFTEDQIENGEADEHLLETITIEDGVVLEHWKREDG